MFQLKFYITQYFFYLQNLHNINFGKLIINYYYYKNYFNIKLGDCWMCKECLFQTVFAAEFVIKQPWIGTTPLDYFL